MKPKTCLSMAICLACTVAAHPSPDGDSAAVATERWSLQRCLDYASERNLNIKISEINAESSDIDVRTAKSAFLPSLSANVSQRIVNNPRSENNTIIDGDRISSSQSKTSYNGSYGIDLQWTLYEGNRRLNDYKQQKVASQIARLNVDESINNIQESIMQAYRRSCRNKPRHTRFEPSRTPAGRRAPRSRDALKSRLRTARSRRKQRPICTRVSRSDPRRL